jgi:hypothetical protein
VLAQAAVEEDEDVEAAAGREDLGLDDELDGAVLEPEGGVI